MSSLSLAALLFLPAPFAAAQQCPPGTTETRVEDSPTELKVYCKKNPAPPRPADRPAPLEPAPNATIALLREQEKASPLLRFDIEHPSKPLIVESPEAAETEDGLEKLARTGPDVDAIGGASDSLLEFGKVFRFVSGPAAEVGEGLGAAFRALAVVDTVRLFQKGKTAEASGRATLIVVGVVLPPAGISLWGGSYLAKNLALGVRNYQYQRAGLGPDRALEESIKRYNRGCEGGPTDLKFICGLTGRAQ